MKAILLLLLVGLAAAVAALGPRAGESASRAALGGSSLDGFKVTIDPGHNGANGAHPSEINQLVPIGNGERKACDTTGTQANSGLTESRFNMSVARRLARLLTNQGAKVVLTRKNDRGVGPCINERARIGNRSKSDAAISIHADGGPPTGRGFHVIYPTKIRRLTDDIYRPSKRLARKIRSTYESGTGLPTATYIGSRGLDARSDLGGLRLSDVPKVFIETGNMRNRSDAKRLERGRFRQRIAVALAKGLNKYLLR